MTATPTIPEVIHDLADRLTPEQLQRRIEASEQISNMLDQCADIARDNGLNIDVFRKAKHRVLRNANGVICDHCGKRTFRHISGGSKSFCLPCWSPSEYQRA